ARCSAWDGDLPPPRGGAEASTKRVWSEAEPLGNETTDVVVGEHSVDTRDALPADEEGHRKSRRREPAGGLPRVLRQPIHLVVDAPVAGHGRGVRRVLDIDRDGDHAHPATAPASR